MFRFVRLSLAVVWLLGTASVHADDAMPITYDDHIAPIFKRHCFQCHGESKQEAGLNLASHAMATKGGSGGAVVVSGRSSTSRLFLAITAEDPAERMPPQNDPLPKEQVAMIKAWIETGLRQNADIAGAPTRTLSFTPTASPSIFPKRTGRFRYSRWPQARARHWSRLRATNASTSLTRRRAT